MKVTVIASETPFPPVRGGKLDVWRRLVAMSASGVQVQLIFWYRPSTEVRHSEEGASAIGEVVASVVEIPRPEGLWDGLRRLARLVRYPIYVANRVVRSREAANIRKRVGEFSPDLVLLDGIYGGELAKDIAHEFKLPLVVRSHNVEHHYISIQARAAHQWLARLKLVLAGIHLRDYETSLLRQCNHFFDCSLHDLEYWRRSGIRHGSWLPNFAGTERGAADGAGAEYDVVYLGSLHTPTNIEGIRWLVSDVLPRIRGVRPEATLLIAGSQPTPAVRRVCARSKNVTLLPDPADALQVYALGRVLVNPVAEGSGSSVKGIEMLGTMRPIVSTPLGVQSMPPEVADLFHIARSGQQFADAVVECLSHPEVDVAERSALLDKHFGRAAISEFISVLSSIASSGHAGFSGRHLE